MTSPLFLLDPEQLGGATVRLTGREGHHAADVRRLRVGEHVDVSDGVGTRLRCRVRAVARGDVELDVVDRRVEPPPRPRVTVAQALVKQEAAERALAGMTEVGVDAVIPWAARRSVVTWDAERVQRGVRRWRSTVAEAAKQSRRAWVPQVDDPLDTRALAARVRTVDVALLLDCSAAQSLTQVSVADASDVLLIVGPEGGLPGDELNELTTAGARPVHLGPSVLRSATAGTVAVAVLLSRTPRWATQVRRDDAG